MNDLKLIKSNQHGFRKSKSCLTNLLDFNEFVAKVLDDGLCLDVLYFDFKKAFDKVPHKLLVKKLHQYGIRGKMVAWIENWLSDRVQKVVLNGFESNWKNVLSGVPQG